MLLLCGAHGLAPPTARAQPGEGAETRAAEAAAQRRAKAAIPVEQPIPTIDRIFSTIEESRLVLRIFDPPEGWFATVGGMAEGNGLTAGGGYRFALGPGQLSARAVGSFRRSYLLDLTWLHPVTEDGRLTAVAQGGRRHEARLLFSGLGPRPPLDESTDFALDATFFDAGLIYRPTPRLSFTGGGGLVAPEVDAPTADDIDDDPEFGDLFTDVTAPGLAHQPRFVVWRGGVLLDLRDAPNARAGALYAVDVRRLHDRGDGTQSFTGTRVEAQHYVPFWNRTRVLALRVVADQTSADAGAVVPFYMRPTIGGSRTLRGFERQRFRDNAVLLMQAEYRYEVNAFVMGAIFADAGQAAPSLSRVRWHDLHTDYGIGLRLGYTTGVAIRTDVAFGGDGAARLIFTFSAAF